jgi:2-oxoglutarate ferredoxin oxidoreductase subunit gamma
VSARREEREVLFTGVGGQGVQICSRTLATAATDEGRYAMLSARYAGGMRGGMTNAEVTVGMGPLRALPVASSAWSAFVMSAEHWETIRPRLRPSAVIVFNSSLMEAPGGVVDPRPFGVPASDMAAELGNPMTAAFVLLGGFAALTGIVSIPSLVAAMRRLIPAYRTEHVAANEVAIVAGADAVPELAAPAWSSSAGSEGSSGSSAVSPVSPVSSAGQS